ncbi:AraC-type DNA-binding protein [Streptoalloteichus tenebrarius]|uniref:AraC-type DNA-binding protein n=1 Tax=Streptoalloteichus tenebrarius (strain ATCC 17920 / DSM 40477 / JCM 4838 / CBS 697.72 / NBRC 16177 / NCIMB 11028 / NRRL B-12390 / A12253. 1 / ISP 5477) TaxID=1933 RepID=A0ABT1HRW0_STRSD|nr:AraC family transcriptional regulator [Streptoalloteichus tenebrarius]MCP2258258.1 AraC-type DNA-binding protein [Streptoalloteichus tenebrarius]BFF04512.1 AraC family transcriptional regulator [Streptoalloteichus tenebrarius]
MEPFDDLLRGLRAEGALFGRSVLSPPWALRFVDGASLTLCVPLRGQGWIVRDDGTPPRLVQEGEAAIVRGPEPFVFADEPRSATRRELCRDVHSGGMDPRVAGEELGSPTIFMVGAYQVRRERPRRLLRVLPPVVVVPDEQDCSAMRAYLEAQLTNGRPGRQIVLDRLLDWLLVCTLRDWFDSADAEPPTWYRALGDDVVGPALRAMHAAPDRPWSLADLAAEAAVSRTTLAKRFTELVGEPPLTYLTEWRMTLAADLLAESTATVGEVARRVGYADAFSFSAAFKRVRGLSPSEYRAGSRFAEADAARRNGTSPQSEADAGRPLCKAT